MGQIVPKPLNGNMLSLFMSSTGVSKSDNGIRWEQAIGSCAQNIIICKDPKVSAIENTMLSRNPNFQYNAPYSGVRLNGTDDCHQ